MTNNLNNHNQQRSKIIIEIFMNEFQKLHTCPYNTNDKKLINEIDRRGFVVVVI